MPNSTETARYLRRAAKAFYAAPDRHPNYWVEWADTLAATVEAGNTPQDDLASVMARAQREFAHPVHPTYLHAWGETLR